MGSEIAQSQSADDCFANGMKDAIGIGMPREPALKGDVNASENQGLPFSKRWTSWECPMRYFMLPSGLKF